MQVCVYSLLLQLFKLALLAGVLFATNVYAENGNNKKIVRVGWYESGNLQTGTSLDTIGGYNYEYLRKIALYANWEYEFYFSTWKECEKKLINGDIDIIGYVAKTPQRLYLYNYPNYSAGVSYLQLVTRKDNAQLSYDDFKSFDDLTVSTVYSSYRKMRIQKLAEQHDFSVNLKEYPSDDEALHALYNNEVDASLVGTIWKAFSGKVIYQFDASPYYFVLNKDRTDLLVDFNNALKTIKTNNAHYDMNIFDSYFNFYTNEKNFSYTADEKAYIAMHNDVKVIVYTNDYPFSFKDKSGKDVGFIYNYLALISQRTGLQFSYIKTDSYTDALSKLERNEGDIFIQLPKNFTLAEKYRADQTQAFSQITLGITARAVSPHDNNIILLKGSEDFIQAPALSQAKLIYSNNIAQTLLKNKNYSAIMTSFMFKNITEEHIHQSWSFTNIPSLTQKLPITVSRHNPTQLYTLLDKTVGNIGQLKASEILNNIANQPRELPFIKKYYFNIITYSIALFFLLALIIIIFLRKSLILTRKVVALSKFDGLTNVLNRQAINERLKTCWRKYKKNGEPFCVALFDMNKFKDINDNYGHVWGDKILITFAQELDNNTRKTDFVGRYGGDEFILVSTNAECKDILNKFERIQPNILAAMHKIVQNSDFSFGFAQVSHEFKTLDDLIIQVDNELYSCKKKMREQYNTNCTGK